MQKVHHLDIEDLYTDLRDGKLPIQLLEVVSGEKIPVPTSKGNMPQIEKFSRIERIGKALDFLQQHNVRQDMNYDSSVQLATTALACNVIMIIVDVSGKAGEYQAK